MPREGVTAPFQVVESWHARRHQGEVGDDRAAADGPVRPRARTRDERARGRRCAPQAARQRAPRRWARGPGAAGLPGRRLLDGAAAPLPALALLRRARLEARRQPGSQRRAARGAGRAPHAPRRAARAPCQPDRLEPGGHLRARAGARAPRPRAPRDHARDTLSRHLGHARRAARSAQAGCRWAARPSSKPPCGAPCPSPSPPSTAERTGSSTGRDASRRRDRRARTSRCAAATPAWDSTPTRSRSSPTAWRRPRARGAPTGAPAGA